MDLGLVVGVVVLGVVHGVLPDHGWPIAAVYALARPRKWLHGTVAAVVLGLGHLVSSVALVLAYFWLSGFASFVEGPYIKPAAGILLVLLGIYEYVSGGHAHGDGHDPHDDGRDPHDDGRDPHDGHHGDDAGAPDAGAHAHSHPHSYAHSHSHGGDDARTNAHAHAHDDNGSRGHGHFDESHARAGLKTLGATALLLGFAHEEPIQILAICAGTPFCLELMLVYSLAVIVAILVPTLLLIAGYQHHRDRVERFTPYLPTITAAVLVVVGLGFIVGVF